MPPFYERKIMKITKTVLDNLNKCYCISNIIYNGKHHIVVAAEKQDQCYLYDLNFEKKATIWDSIGGTMSIVPLENKNGDFLATQKFYSPNDSKDAQIVYVKFYENYNFELKTLAVVPFAHRFDILKGKDGTKYLLVCALKSGHEYKDDWRFKGKTYFKVLPENLDEIGILKEHDFKLIQDNMLKNHGYYKVIENGIEKALISCDSGVYLYTAPENLGDDFKIELLVNDPASDATLIDLDGDGLKELIVFSPFHGNKLKIYKIKDNKYYLEKEFEEDFNFLHAIWSGKIKDKNVCVIGHRRDEMLTFILKYDGNDYVFDIIDKEVGAANVNHFIKDNVDYIIAANREIDEIALYKIE